MWSDGKGGRDEGRHSVRGLLKMRWNARLYSWNDNRVNEEGGGEELRERLVRRRARRKEM